MKPYRLLVLAAAVALIGAGCQKAATPSASDTTKNDSYSQTSTTPETPAPAPTTPESNTMSDQNVEGPMVLMKTSKGDITLQLNEKAAPKTVANFVSLINKNFYSGIQFHRVIKGFMIQGGDPLTKSDPTNYAIHGTGGPGYTIEDEFNNGLKNVRGAIAMARTAAPHSAGSQFYIVTNDTPSLDGNYTVFGKVISGMDVVDAIVSVPTTAQDHPIDPVTIKSVEIIPGK